MRATRAKPGGCALLAAIVLARCGADQSTPPDAQPAQGAPAAQPSQVPSQTAPTGAGGGGTTTGGPASDPLRGDDIVRGRKAVPIPGGGVAYVPVEPKATTLDPSPSCTKAKDGYSGHESTLPPRPGLRARRLDGRSVLVTVTFASIPDACRPVRVKLTFDVNDDPLPPAAHLFTLRQLRAPRKITLALDVRAADVVRASSITADGTSSESAAVAITR